MVDHLDVCSLCGDCFPLNSLLLQGNQWLCLKCRTPEPADLPEQPSVFES